MATCLQKTWVTLSTRSFNRFFKSAYPFLGDNTAFASGSALKPGPLFAGQVVL